MTQYIPLIGAAVLLFAWLRRNEVVRFAGGEVLTCLVSQDVVILGCAAYLYLFGYGPTEYDPSGVAAWRYAAAGLEDALFVLPAFLLPRPWRYGFIALSSVSFISGHLYQGIPSAAAKGTYVVMGYMLAARFGILTTIVAHSLNDIAVLILVYRLTGKI